MFCYFYFIFSHDKKLFPGLCGYYLVLLHYNLHPLAEVTPIWFTRYFGFLDGEYASYFFDFVLTAFPAGMALL